MQHDVITSMEEIQQLWDLIRFEELIVPTKVNHDHRQVERHQVRRRAVQSVCVRCLENER